MKILRKKCRSKVRDYQYLQKNQKGITLIALVLTIIVLLILAGVSINLVAGSNGIMNKAVKSVTATKEAQKEEEIQLKLAEIMMDYYVEGRRRKFI